MGKTASEIVSHALTLIDEQVTDFLDAATTEMSVKDIAHAILPSVARELIKELPHQLKKYLSVDGNIIRDSLTNGESQDSYTKQMVAYLLPDDFWELDTIRLSSWKRPVVNYITPESVLYQIQTNPFTRSGESNPTVVLSTTSPNGGGYGGRIECYSVHKDNVATVDVALFRYISFNNVPDDSGNTWADELFAPITNALSSELHLIKRRIEEGQIMGDEALTKLEQHE